MKRDRKIKRRIGSQNNQKIGIVTLLLVIIGILAVVSSTQKSQDIRNRAVGTGEVDIRFDPSSGTYSPGQSFDVYLKLYATAGNISVSGAEATVNVSDQFTINSYSCTTPFDKLTYAIPNGQNITFRCAVGLPDPPPNNYSPVVVTSAGQSFAKINLTVKSSAQPGTTMLLSFPIISQGKVDTRVTRAGLSGQAPDVSTSGQNASFTIPTLTPIPPTLIPTSTPTPVLPTSTATPTPINQPCQMTTMAVFSGPLSVGQTSTLQAEKSPATAQISCVSNNPNIIAVDSTNNSTTHSTCTVRAVATGTAIIQVGLTLNGVACGNKENVTLNVGQSHLGCAHSLNGDSVCVLLNGPGTNLCSVVGGPCPQ